METENGKGRPRKKSFYECPICKIELIDSREKMYCPKCGYIAVEVLVSGMDRKGQTNVFSEKDPMDWEE